MSRVFKAAFMFVAPHARAAEHQAWVRTAQVEVKMIAVADYESAIAELDTLIAEGIQAIELCAGFGHQGVARMVEAAADRLPVGVVRFDKHPCLGHVSGDTLFQ
ncbi:DUF6506 family protein [Aeromonas sp. R6-2]|uniref:DUF6506 family protein n=1 Tax=unclassified Aeromonas TaxID=257493 RepID=UPI0034A283CA